MSGISLSLEKEADRERLSVDDQIKQGDAAARKWMAPVVVGALILGNVVILVGLGVLVRLDQANVVGKVIAPADRIVNSQVIMALLGATTVQVGAIAAIIARYLFPGRSRDG